MAAADADSLEYNGFKGFCDSVTGVVDSMETELQNSIARSCVLLVLMNDETIGSFWCKQEWTWAHTMGIPIQCVIDMERCCKQAVCLMPLAPFLLSLMWLRRGRVVPRCRTIQYIVPLCVVCRCVAQCV